MKIIQIPHKSLRKKAVEVTRVDKKLLRFTEDLRKTLDKANNPKGVGLAAPQVNKLIRAFAMRVGGINDDENIDEMPVQILINPTITKHSEDLVVGPKPDEPRMEGCLSMPNMWGPVFRWQWIETEFQVINGGELVSEKARFENFAARVFQHELDHLDGVLFTDHSLEYDLPVYTEKNNKLVEIEDRTILESY